MVRSYTLLLAEDEAELSRVLTMKLKKEGFEVRLCRDGGEAIDRLSREKVDSVVLDIDMPVKDGLTVLREMQGTKNAKTPVYMLTAFEDAEHKAQAVALGARGYFMKPDTALADFIRVIREDLEEERLMAAERAAG